MIRIICGALATCWLACHPALAAEKTKILLVGKDRDHPFLTHEYMADCRLLARCLEQTPGVEAVVTNGWPKDAAVLRGVRAIVLYTAKGGDVLFEGPQASQVDELLRSGVGLTALHWGTGASTDEVGGRLMRRLGGWFNTRFSRLAVTTTRLNQADPGHPICRGWKEYDLRDEYYLRLRFLPDIHAVLAVHLNQEEHPVAWVYERPGSNGGRSFGFVCGHFHADFGIQSFRQAVVNGILWTAHRDIPAAGAPCAVTADDLNVPPPPLKASDRIVFLGDSITQAGVGPKGYVTLIRQALAKRFQDRPPEIIGAGISGNKVPDLQRRLARDVLARKPTIVVIYIGINDVWHGAKDPTKGTPRDRYEAGLREIIGKIQGTGARVLLCTPSVIGEKADGSNSLDARLDEYAATSRQVANGMAVQLCDLRQAFLDYLRGHNPENREKGILTTDGVHLTDLGNHLVAQTILRALGEPAASRP
jgi:lysophospholipase L1-like esterase/type 1 glutamine amidotransferase